jgi:signal transduction histidine kinase
VEQILVESEHKLKEANATKDKFFSIISHDLRNPFNTILGYSDLLTSNFDDYTEDEKRKIIAELNYSAKHTYSLLDNLLNWANTQLGRIEINKELIDLKLLVRDSIVPYLSSASEKQIRVLNNIPEDFNINCDKATIGIVIGNIFNNSIKFTEKKGLITLNAESGKESVAIKITDTGVGMTKNVKNKLFKIDECKSLPGTESEQGTGLGLILCKEFIEKNGGSIEVESELGEGSTFTIKLPVE